MRSLLGDNRPFWRTNTSECPGNGSHGIDSSNRGTAGSPIHKPCHIYPKHHGTEHLSEVWYIEVWAPQPPTEIHGFRRFSPRIRPVGAENSLVIRM